MGAVCCARMCPCVGQKGKYDFTNTSANSNSAIAPSTNGVVKETGTDSGHVAHPEDQVYSNQAFKEHEIHTTHVTEKKAAPQIETTGHQHVVEKSDHQHVETSGHQHVVEKSDHQHVETSDHQHVVSEVKEEKAATTIQAGFRGYKDRQKVKTIRNEQDSESKSSTESSDTHRRDKGEIDHTLSEEMAAAKIQAGYKGYKTRKEIQAKREEQMQELHTNAESEEDEAGGHRYREPTDGLINHVPESEFLMEQPAMTDAEMEAAAIRIQATYKGYKTRKTLDSKRSHDDEASTDGAEEVHQEPEPDKHHFHEDKEVMQGVEGGPRGTDAENDAATRIQAHYKGYKTRQSLDKEKAKEGED